MTIVPDEHEISGRDYRMLNGDLIHFPAGDPAGDLNSYLCDIIGDEIKKISSDEESWDRFWRYAKEFSPEITIDNFWDAVDHYGDQICELIEADAEDIEE